MELLLNGISRKLGNNSLIVIKIKNKNDEKKDKVDFFWIGEQMITKNIGNNR